MSTCEMATLEDMRCALLHLLVEGMDSSFARSQKSVRAQRKDVPASTTSEEELEKLVGEIVRGVRRRNGKASRKVSCG